MINALFVLIWTLLSLFKDRRDLAIEILALRQQLLVYKRLHPRPPLRPQDRLFWVWLPKLWSGWQKALIIVQPETARRMAPQRVQFLLDEDFTTKECWSASRQCRSQIADQADGRS
jgi:hypothetical protein